MVIWLRGSLSTLLQTVGQSTSARTELSLLTATVLIVRSSVRDVRSGGGEGGGETISPKITYIERVVRELPPAALLQILNSLMRLSPLKYAMRYLQYGVIGGLPSSLSRLILDPSAAASMPQMNART